MFCFQNVYAIVPEGLNPSAWWYPEAISMVNFPNSSPKPKLKEVGLVVSPMRAYTGFAKWYSPPARNTGLCTRSFSTSIVAAISLKKAVVELSGLLLNLKKRKR